MANLGISYNNISAFVNDNVSYMSKACEKMAGILPNAVHCKYSAHIFSLVGRIWRKSLKDVDFLVAPFKSTLPTAPQEGADTKSS